MTQATLPNRLLQMLSEGGIHSIAELARRLDTSDALVTAIAEDLTRHGYLVLVPSKCETSCSGCWAAGSCGGPEAAPLLAVTARGRRASGRTR
jgi:thioredoxin reductase